MKKLRQNKIKFLTLILSVVLLIIFKLKYLGNTEISITNGISFVIISLICCVLIYLSLHDSISLEIPFKETLALTIFLITLNIAIALTSIPSFILFDVIPIIGLNNLIGGFICATLVWIIIIATKNSSQAIGEGEIYLGAIMGLSLGIDKLIVGLYLTIFSATIYAFIYCLRIAKFKDVKIPMVPFISIGIICSILFYTELQAIYTSFFVFNQFLF